MRTDHKIDHEKMSKEEKKKCTTTALSLAQEIHGLMIERIFFDKNKVDKRHVFTVSCLAFSYSIGYFVDKLILNEYPNIKLDLVDEILAMTKMIIVESDQLRKIISEEITH